MYLKLRIAHTQRMAIFPLDGAFCGSPSTSVYGSVCVCVCVLRNRSLSIPLMDTQLTRCWPARMAKDGSHGCCSFFGLLLSYRIATVASKRRQRSGDRIRCRASTHRKDNRLRRPICNNIDFSFAARALVLYFRFHCQQKLKSSGWPKQKVDWHTLLAWPCPNAVQKPAMSQQSHTYTRTHTHTQRL